MQAAVQTAVQTATCARKKFLADKRERIYRVTQIRTVVDKLCTDSYGFGLLGATCQGEVLGWPTDP